jgi:hypothetical protein
MAQRRGISPGPGGAEPHRRQPRRDEHQAVEDARIRALENMKNHEALYMEFLESLSGKKEVKSYEMEKEEGRVMDLIDKNAKIVHKLVTSFFDEIKDQWAKNLQENAQARLEGNIGYHIKKTRQKISKLRKISESFVNGNYEEDLLSYALEKNLDETAQNIQNLTREIEASERNSNSNVTSYNQVSITFHKEKIQDFFAALQDLVEVNLQAQPEPPKIPTQKTPVIEENQNKIRNSKDQRDKRPRPWDNQQQEDHQGSIKGYKEKTRQPLQQRNFIMNDSNLLKPSQTESFDEICLKKYLEPKKHSDENQMQRPSRPSHNKPSLDSHSPSPVKPPQKGYNDRTDSKDYNKENKLDMSKMTSKEIFDLDQNSVNDLLHSDLGVTRLQGTKKTTSTFSPPDHLEKSSFSLHFFQPRSNKLHLVDHKDGQFTKKTMELGDFMVPRYHRSLLKEQDVIILTGGYVDDKPSKKAYLLDIDRALMTEISEMTVGRTGHVLIYHRKLFYAIGGVADDGSTTDTCEVFSPQLNTWSEIARTNHAVHSACGLSANGHIYVFGGKNDLGHVSQTVEVLRGEAWTELKVDLAKFRLYNNSLAFQVSHQEIMLVGGTEDEYEHKTRDAFLIALPEHDRQTVLECRRGPPLPVEEGFWSQEVEYAGGKFYMLQNVVHLKDKNSVLLDQRRVLEYSPLQQKWAVISLN